MPHDVFEHHDGIVDHEADREDERHHRQVIQAEVQQLHHSERAEDREGQRQGRDQRRGSVVQEQIDDADHQDERDEHRHLDVAECLPDVHRAVLADDQVHGRGQLALEPWQHGAHGVGDLDHVRARLLQHFERDGTLPRVFRDVPRPLRHRLHAVEHVGDLVQPYRPAVAVRHHNLAEFVRVVQLPLREDAVGRLRSEQLARRLGHVPVLERGVDFVDADLLRFQLLGIDLNPHGVLGRSLHVDLRHAADDRDARGEDVLRVFVDFRHVQ